MINKGFISSLLDDGKTAVVIPQEASGTVTFPLTVPDWLRGCLKVQMPVVYVTFEDNTGMLLSRLDGIKASTAEDGNLPDVTEADNGKVLMVENGIWQAKDFEMNIDVYDGDCTVTPSVEGCTLNTAQKLMNENVTVKAIPYQEIENGTGGKTVIIG